MSQLIHTLDFAGPAPALFEAFLRHLRARGFHIEEADAVGLRIHAERDRGLLSSLFGIGTLHVHVRFVDADTVQVRITSAGERERRLLDELKDLAAAQVKATAVAAASQAAREARQAAPVVVSQVVVREIVKIPCRFCGSLIENTQTRCPHCGGE